MLRLRFPRSLTGAPGDGDWNDHEDDAGRPLVPVHRARPPPRLPSTPVDSGRAEPRDDTGSGEFLIDGTREFDYPSTRMNVINTLLPAVLLAGCATTSTPSPEEAFKRADKNGDGSVDRTETTHMIIADAFELYDADGDGFVDETEFINSGGNAENFKTINKSGSGKITLAEAQASPLVFNTFVVGFDEADTNKDGKVTLVEYQDYLKMRDAAVR